MKLTELFNTTEEQVNNKQHNIFIPLCLGNKFFTIQNKPTDNVKRYIDWAREHSRKTPLLIIADDIQITNYRVRNSTNSESQNRRKISKDGDEIRNNLKEMVDNDINIIRWKDYETNDLYCSKTSHILYKEFKNNPEFRDYLLHTVKTSVTDRPFSEEEYYRLADYILDEFSLCYSGITYGQTHYDLLLYPETDSALHFILDIQQGMIFPELSKQLPQQKTGVAILQ